VKRLGVLATLVPVLLLAVKSAGATSRHRRTSTPSCAPTHARGILSDAQARVYGLRTEGAHRSEGFLKIFACAHRHRSYELEGLVTFDEIQGPCLDGCLPPRGTIALGGAIVAYADTMLNESRYGPCYCSDWHVVVLDLRTGRDLQQMPTGEIEPPRNPQPYPTAESGEYVGVGPAVKVAVKSDGSVAWLAENLNLRTGRPPYYEVHVVDRGGSRVVASAANIKPASFRLAGNRLHWTQGGKPESASLR
jgi:hypothetical protein